MRQKAERGGARGSDTVDRMSLEGGSAVRLRPVVLEGVERRLERVVVVVAARGAHRPRRPLVISSGEKQTRTKASVKEVGEKRCTRLGSKGSVGVHTYIWSTCMVYVRIYADRRTDIPTRDKSFSSFLLFFIPSSGSSGFDGKHIGASYILAKGARMYLA